MRNFVSKNIKITKYFENEKLAISFHARMEQAIEWSQSVWEILYEVCISHCNVLWKIKCRSLMVPVLVYAKINLCCCNYFRYFLLPHGRLISKMMSIYIVYEQGGSIQ